MRVLADTNLFVKFVHRQPLPQTVEEVLADEATERFISAASVIEVFRLWQAGRLLDNPDKWMDPALASWTVVAINTPIARQSVLWSWQHKDPADRLIAATAHVEKIELWHTDTVLKKFTGFPHRYFSNVLEKPSA
jgi:PIN domain nuclease of toxin-antitoxin system